MRGRQEDREADPVKPGSTENNFRDLARLAFFRGANSAALAAAAPRTRWIFAGTGELLLDFGDATNDVFLVVRGAVRIVVRTPLGQELILSDLGAGEIFGEMAAIDGAPRSASATALNTTSLCRLPAATFLDVVLRSPEVGLRLLRILTARLRLQGERSSELALLPARLRLAAELLRLSRPRSSGHSERVLSPPLSQHILGARIGVRREHVSRVMGQLVRQGLVEISPHAIILLHPETLRTQIDEQLRSASDASSIRCPSR